MIPDGTFDQSDRLREDGVEIEVVPAWQWLAAENSKHRAQGAAERCVD